MADIPRTAGCLFIPSSATLIPPISEIYIILIKVLIVQTPGLGPKVFLTAPLSLFQWFVCLLAGLGSLICYQLVIFIPTSSPKSDKIPTKRGKHRTMSVEMEKMGEPIMKARGINQELRPQQMASSNDESLEEIKTY